MANKSKKQKDIDVRDVLDAVDEMGGFTDAEKKKIGKELRTRLSKLYSASCFTTYRCC